MDVDVFCNIKCDSNGEIMLNSNQIHTDIDIPAVPLFELYVNSASNNSLPAVFVFVFVLKKNKFVCEQFITNKISNL